MKSDKKYIHINFINGGVWVVVVCLLLFFVCWFLLCFLLLAVVVNFYRSRDIQ